MGHSQGGTCIIAALSDPNNGPRERLSAMIKNCYLMSPVVFLAYNPPALVRWFKCIINPVFGLLDCLKVRGIMGVDCRPNRFIVRLGRTLRSCCPCLLNKIAWKNTETTNRNNDISLFPTYLQYFPSGHSFRSVKHFV